MKISVIQQMFVECWNVCTSDCRLVVSRVVHDGDGGSRRSSGGVSGLHHCLLLLLPLLLLGRNLHYSGVFGQRLGRVLERKSHIRNQMLILGTVLENSNRNEYL